MKRYKKILLWLPVIIILLCSSLAGSVSAEESQASVEAFSYTNTSNESIKVSSRIWELLFGKEKVKSEESESLYLLTGGDIFGARIKQDHVTVNEVEDGCPLKHGDIIISINGSRIKSVSDVKARLSECGGKPIEVTVLRGKEKSRLSITPETTTDGYKIGATLRDGAAGIGTVTYIDPETGMFGGLGHGICDSESGEIIDIISGEVTGVVLGGIQKGDSGKPGELCGILTDKVRGEVCANTAYGIFGRLDELPDTEVEPIEVAKRSEVHDGKATIISTLKNGKKSEYDIEIFDTDADSLGTKCFKIKVTDDALLAISGGIVRGMSGSPIIQDGKLVGAVTHVMVADPTEGYGIFIENMLSAADSQAMPKAA